MSFAACAARSFTHVSVAKNAPETCGVYGLCNNREWVFIGEADNIQASLLQHLGDTASMVSLRVPTGFVFEVCDIGQRSARQNVLVNKFGPSCNEARSPQPTRHDRRH